MICVAMLPTLLHLIPLSALAAMLVYTGFRLAHPREFIEIYKIGREQFFIFVATILGVLATDLLIGVPCSSIFRPCLEVEYLDEARCLIRAHQSAIFSNWIPFRRQIENLGIVQRRNITVDLSNLRLVDHSTLEKLLEMKTLFAGEGLEFTITGLENLTPFSEHATSTRVGRAPHK